MPSAMNENKDNKIMLTVLIQSLALASGGIVSVGSITIVILLLISDKGWRNGLAYMIGYVSAYTLIGLSVVVLSSNYIASSENTTEESGITASVLFVIMGCLLLWLTIRNWRKKPSDTEEEKPPRFFAILDKITPLRALLFGVAISVINFKNLAIFMSAISVLLVSDLLLLTKIGITLLIVLVFCTSVIIPVVIYLAFPETANQRLNWLKLKLEAHSRPIGIWMPLIFGLIFLTRGTTGLI